MLSNLSAGRKLLTVFGAFTALGALGTAVLMWAVVSVSDLGLSFGERLAPQIDAAMEVKLSASEARLEMEEFLLQEEDAEIDGVTEALEETRANVLVFLEGGEVDGEAIEAASDPELREMAKTLLEHIQPLNDLVPVLKATVERAQGVGSDADERFDSHYENLVGALAAVAADHPGLADL